MQLSRVLFSCYNDEATYKLANNRRPINRRNRVNISNFREQSDRNDWKLANISTSRSRGELKMHLSVEQPTQSATEPRGCIIYRSPVGICNINAYIWPRTCATERRSLPSQFECAMNHIEWRVSQGVPLAFPKREAFRPASPRGKTPAPNRNE